MNNIASVVIPVYNKEKFISECLDSLVSQSCGIDKIEVICVNDGSSDNSENIIEGYCKKYKSIKLINQVNAGVGAARNKGIKTSTSDYIFFLDADDRLSSSTISEVVSFFKENHEKTDIVTYPLFYMDAQGRNPYGHKRNKIAKRSQVIDISWHPEFAQTTMNFCIKRNDGLSLFDTELVVAEDQIFNLERVLNRKSIGWCAKAKYYYRRNIGGANEFTHPYYTFSKVIEAYNRMFLMAGDDDSCRKYVANLVLYNLSFRIRGDTLYPYHLKGDNWNLAVSKIKDLVNKIGVDVIKNSPWILEYHKSYLINMTDENVTLDLNPNLWRIKTKNTEIFSGNTVTAILRRVSVKDSFFSCSGFLSSPLFNFSKKPELSAFINNQKCYIELFQSLNSMRGTKIEINRTWGFHFSCKVSNNDNIKFKIFLDGNSYDVTFWSDNWTSLKNFNVAFFEPLSVVNNNDALLIRNVSTLNKEFNNWKKKLGRSKWRYIIRRKISRFLSRQEIWLYNDFVALYGNSWLQFLHDCKKNDGIKRYYVYFDNKDNMPNNTEIPKNAKLIKHGSLMHKLLFPAARKIITSFLGTEVFSPFTPDRWFGYNGFNNPSLIYLQHGVMHAKADHIYAKDRLSFIDKIVASTDFECEYFQKRLNFSPEDIIKTGMPRFTNLHVTKGKKNRILFAPSWRRNLVGKEFDRWVKNNKFDDSDFYMNITSFLLNEKLHSILLKNNFYLDVKPHPIFSMYHDKFLNLCKDNVRLIDDINYNDYALLITDFSSFLFDFLYLNIPVVSYIPDKEQFDAGFHTYRELTVQLSQNGVIEFFDQNLLVDYLDKFTSSDVHEKSPAIKFYGKGRDICEDIYNAIINS